MKAISKIFLIMLLVPMISSATDNYGSNQEEYAVTNFRTQKRANSEQTSLFTPVNKIDDGGVYFIRNANDTNLVWDMPNGNTNDGVAPILYNSLGWGNQRFIIREQTTYNGKMYYTISPLNAPSKILRTNANSDGDKLIIGNDKNTNLANFLSNKFIIEKSTYGFTISTGISTFGKYIVPKDDKVESNNTLVQKTVSNATTNRKYQWEFLKTDTLGLDLKNKVEIRGTNSYYYNLTPPSTGEYIIETQTYTPGEYVDTYLELYDSDNNLLVSNDDSGGYYNARITYNFTNLNDVKIRLRGYNSSASGYTYLVLRPKNAVYFSAVYDYDKNNNDRPGSLEGTKEFLPNYHVDIQANRGKNAILEYAPNGKRKINSEYFVFSGHGYSNVAGVEFYNGTAPEGFGWNEIPSLDGTQIAIWMTCHGARNYFKYGTSGEMTSMAYQSVYQGADYSLGYVGTIYDTTQRTFPAKFFEALQKRSIPDAVEVATQWTKDANWWWWTFYGQFNDDFDNPILYKKGDKLKTSCGNGKYEDDKKKSTNIESLENSKLIAGNEYVNNTNSGSSIIKVDNFSKLESAYSHKFLTTYNGKEYKLGFKNDEDEGRVTYFNFTDNTEISSFMFEKMMGKPTPSIKDFLSSI